MTHGRNRIRRWASTAVCVLVLTAMPLFTVTVIYAGYTAWRAHFGGISGKLTVSACDWRATRTGGYWDCGGPFVSNDQQVRIKWVNLDAGAQHWSAGTALSVCVSGHDADDAWLISDRWWWVEELQKQVIWIMGDGLAVLICGERVASLARVMRRGRQTHSAEDLEQQPQPRTRMQRRAKRLRR